jgi:RNA polymerase sigma factor (sigma-70 family)
VSGRLDTLILCCLLFSLLGIAKWVRSLQDLQTTLPSLSAFILVRSHHMDLQELLENCRQHDIVAQKKLYDQFALSMFVICRRYVTTDEVAEEMMMNGFLKFFRSLPKFQFINEAATAGCMKKIMVNECLMHLRSNNSFLQIPIENMPELSIGDDVINNMSAGEIFILITKLPPGYRTVFNLYAIENMPHKEIAELLGISEGTSKSQLSKAKGMLQQMVIKNNEDYACRKTK